MTAYKMPLQAPAKAPSRPQIPALPGEPGAATTAQRAGEAATAAQQAAADAERVAADAQRVAIEAQQIAGQAAQGPVIADAPAPPPLPPPFTTSSGFPIDPAAIIREAIPIFGISLAMMMVLLIGWPLARAFARRSDKRLELGAANARDLQPQMRQLQESLDLMAVELERISEAQRFQAKLMSERALPEGQKRG